MQPEESMVIGVLAASGGLGSSSLACAVARLSADAGAPTLLVDLAPCGGGLDQLVGVPYEPGARWPTADRAVLGLRADRLPVRDGLRVLSHGGGPAAARDPGAASRQHGDRRCPLGPAALETVARLARGEGATVLDLPRADHPAASGWWDLCDHVVLLAGTGPTQVRAALAARSLLRSPALGLVARPAQGCGLDPHDLSQLLGVPLLHRVGHDPSVAAALADQEPPGGRPGPLRDAAWGVLARVAERSRGAA